MNNDAAAQWYVVGGADRGGILVREGQDLESEQFDDRLEHGATIETIKLVGERLNYKVVDPNTRGPAQGWVSLQSWGKNIVVPKMKQLANTGGPADTSLAVEVDPDLKKKIEEKEEMLNIRAGHMKETNMLILSALKYRRFGCPLDQPKFRIFCFHVAGGTESVFTTSSIPARWKHMHAFQSIEMIALNYPGRDRLAKEPFITDIHALAEWLLAIIHKKMGDGVPYMFWGHAVGTWVGFEVLQLARKMGLPMPQAAIFNAFPAPHMEVKNRPWKRSNFLDDKGLQAELRAWDETHFEGAGKVVFSDQIWETNFEQMIRADFALFTEYEFLHKDAPKYKFPIHAWHMENDKRNNQEMIGLWKDWTTGEFDTCVMKGMGHLTSCYAADHQETYYAKVHCLIEKYSDIE